MSQIVNAFIVTDEQLSKLNQLALREAWDEYRDFMHTETQELPEFLYSAPSMSCLFPFLDKRGIPTSASCEQYEALHKKFIALVNPADGKAISESLLELETTDDELNEYFANFYGVPYENAAEEMYEGIEYLRNACEKAVAASAILIIDIG